MTLDVPTETQDASQFELFLKKSTIYPPIRHLDVINAVRPKSGRVPPGTPWNDEVEGLKAGDVSNGAY